MSATQGFAGVLGLCLLSVPAAAQVTSRVSVATGGVQANGLSFGCAVSGDGRWVAFTSYASNLVGLDANGTVGDVFVRDLLTGTTELASVSTGGVQGNAASGLPSISADGRFVAFASDAGNLVSGDSNPYSDVFVRDRVAGTTELVSLDSSGVHGNCYSNAPAISADGRFIAFESCASNLVAGDTNGNWDIFVHDRLAGTTERVSVSSAGAEANDHCSRASISADGRFVAFESQAFTLVPGDGNMASDVFLRDRLSGSTVLVSVATAGTQGNQHSFRGALSADGKFVAFGSYATNLVAGGTSGAGDVYVRDLQLGTTELVSIDPSGAPGNGNSGTPSISPDGQLIAFESGASNLVGGDTNGKLDILLRDLHSGTTERISLSSAGGQGDADSYHPALCASGRWIAFESDATNLVVSDSNGSSDIFARDRGVPGFSSACEPGVGGVLACPCANPPGAPGRGCDNSAGTGGAQLTASGFAYLSQDTLVLQTSGQLPADLSIVLQGNAEISGGRVFGQGVRCAGGALKRLYAKTSVSGGIAAPDTAVGDLAVSLRSAQLGDAIQAGESRWYLVYYRDPIVLGACPATSTFNATQTGSVLWWP